MITAENHHNCKNKIEGLKKETDDIFVEIEKTNERVFEIENYIWYKLKNEL